MPIYPYACDACGAEFEVSRKVSAMRDPAPCPACGDAARRLFSGVTVTGRAAAPGPAATKPAGGWSHGGHSHGPGSAGHTH